MKTAALTGSLVFGFVCFVLAAIGAVKTSTALFCGVSLICGWSALMLLLVEPIDGAEM